MGNNLKAGFLTLALGSAGDLASRAIWLNCSIDKPWTMLFALPPLSVVSAFMHFLKKIEKGSLTCMDAVDIPLFIIPVMTILLAFIIPKIIKEPNYLPTLLLIISTFILFAVSRMYRSNKMCKVHFGDNNKGFGANHILRACLISAVINGIVFLFNMAAPYGEMLPVVGIPFTIWGLLGNVPGLQQAIPLTIAHFGFNLYDNVKSNLEKLCNKAS